MKVIDKIKAASDEGKVIFSFEFLTPRPKEDLNKLFSLIGRMVDNGPLFCDLTWRAGGREADLSLEVSNRMQNEVGIETILHLACTGMTVEMIDHALDTARANGIHNILALKGDPVKGLAPVEGEFMSALELVKHIRARHGDYFGIIVAGYPGGGGCGPSIYWALMRCIYAKLTVAKCMHRFHHILLQCERFFCSRPDTQALRKYLEIAYLECK